MRKCPNCKKPVPIGARKCVHCRTSLTDSPNIDMSSTRMGVGNSVNDPLGYDRAESTSFGRPSSGYNDEMDFRAQMNQAFNENPHQTMLGLGPITGRSERNNWGDQNQGFAQTTIAGMPGISFDQSRMPAAGGYRPALNVGAPQVNPNQYNQPMRESHVPMVTPNSVPEQRWAQNSVPEQRIAPPVHDRKMPQNPVPEQSVVNEPKVIQEQKQAPSQPQEAEDVLFGLPGVAAPMPSSLVDEEFEDLTSKLFGDDYAQVNLDDDEEDEDDDLDFDVQPAAAPAVVTAPAKPEPTKPEPQPVKPQPVVTSAVATKVQPAEEEEEEYEEEEEEVSAPAPSQEASSLLTILTCISTGVTLICILIGIFMDHISMEGGDFIMLGAILIALADAGYLLFPKKVSSAVWLSIFAITALILLGILLTTNAGQLMVYTLAAVATQVTCACAIFLKK